MAAGNDLHRGTRAAKGLGGTSARVGSVNAPVARKGAPADLVAFLHAKTVTEVAAALETSRKTAYRLRHGYWPDDARRILSAWQAYKGRADAQGGWFLRRVHAGGVVRHAGREWAAHGLSACAGRTVAVARTADGLLAQTLDMPPERMALAPVQEVA